MDYNKLTNFSTNKTNPFLDETFNQVVKGEKIIYSGKRPDVIIDGETGEIKGESFFRRKVKVDKATFGKIYILNLKLWYDLSKSAMKVFGYIMENIRYNSDMFLFDLESCKDYTGYSAKNTIFNAISELIENKFIARTRTSNVYFINPSIFFNGDRLILFTEIEKNEKIKGDINEFEDAKVKLIEN
jgi:hypothetical protein